MSDLVNLDGLPIHILEIKYMIGNVMKVEVQVMFMILLHL